MMLTAGSQIPTGGEGTFSEDIHDNEPLWRAEEYKRTKGKAKLVFKLQRKWLYPRK